MKNILGQGKGVEAIPDLKLYQACTRGHPIVARTLHDELRFPTSFAHHEFNAQGNPIL